MASGIMRTAMFGAATVVLAAGSSFGQCTSMEKLVAWDRAPNDYFGSAVSVSRHTVGAPWMAVGAWGDDNARGVNAGSVYLFTKPEGQGWTGETRVMATDGQPDDNFGASVSIHDPYMIVGATGVGDWGAAYVFRRNGSSWTQLTKLMPAGTEVGADAGRSVSAWGAWSVVGAPLKDVGANADAGAAYIYRADANGSVTLQHTINGTSAGQNLGAAVAFGSEFVAVGVPGGEILNLPTDHGFVRVVRRDAQGVWQPDGFLISPEPAAGDRFGSSIAVAGTLVVVGAPMDDRSAAQGGVLADSGSAFVFERVDGTWTLLTELRASDAEAHAHFGSSVAITGGQVVVGAAGAKKAYVFRHSMGVWYQDAVLSDPDGNDTFAASVAISPDGSEAIVGDSGDDPSGMTNAGAVYVQALAALPSDSCAGAQHIHPGMITGCTASASRDGTTTCGAPNLQGPDVWYRWVPECSGTAALNTFGSMFDTVLSVHTGCPEAAGSQTLVCNDDAPGFTGGASALLLEFTGGTPYYIRVSGYNGARGHFVLSLNVLTAPANDACAGATAVGNGVYEFSLCNAETEMPGTLPCPQVPVAIFRDVWFRYTATCTGQATVDMCGSTGDKVVAVYDGAACPQDGGGAIACVDDNFPWDGQCSSPFQPRVTFPVVSGQSYLIRVGNAYPAATQAVMTISCTPACRADWNNDGAVNSTDISAFITSWLGSIQQGHLVADFNGDGQVNSTDISAYISAWLAAIQHGC